MSNSKHAILSIAKECSVFRGHILMNSSPDGLMDLIRDPKFSFDLNLSEFMMNYYDSHRFFIHERFGADPKRRLSLVNYLGFYFSQYIQSQNVPIDKLREINEALKGDNRKEIQYAWDWAVYLGVLSLGLFEIYIRLIPSQHHPSGYYIEISTNPGYRQFNLSEQLRKTFFDQQGNVLQTGKMAPFLKQLIIEIDRVRDWLDWDKLSPQQYEETQGRKKENAESPLDPYAVQALQSLPSAAYAKMDAIIYRDETDAWYALEFEPLAIPKQVNPGSGNYYTTPETLRDAIEQEFGFLHKMKARIARTQ